MHDVRQNVDTMINFKNICLPPVDHCLLTRLRIYFCSKGKIANHSYSDFDILINVFLQKSWRRAKPGKSFVNCVLIEQCRIQ